MSCTGKGTICNMGAEIGATTSTFGYDESMERYLRSTDRNDVADAANEVKDCLTADPEVYISPEDYFDELIEIDLSTLMPHINGPFTPDLATEVGSMNKKAKANDWPLKVDWGLIGSCTNSSYEDLSRAASIAQQALDKDLITKAEFGINPGSEQVRFTADRDGILEVFQKLNAIQRLLLDDLRIDDVAADDQGVSIFDRRKRVAHVGARRGDRNVHHQHRDR